MTTPSSVSLSQATAAPLPGDRFVFLFDVPVAQEDHAQRAGQAALEIQRRLREG